MNNASQYFGSSATLDLMKWATHKKPSPSRQATCSIHVIGDDSCKKTRDSSCNWNRRVEERVSRCELIFPIPGREEKGTSWGKSGLDIMLSIKVWVVIKACYQLTSANPRRNLRPATWLQFCVAPISAAKVPQTRPSPGRKTLGRTRVRIMFAGTSNTR